MSSTIPFVSESTAKSKQNWITHLAKAMPTETIKPFDQLTDAEKANAEIALVADPDPAQLKSLPRLKWVQSMWAGIETMMAELNDARFAIVRLEDPLLAKTMAEAVLAWTLYLHRDMPRYLNQQRERVWHEHRYPGPGVRHIGILGLGKLGYEAARVLVRAGFQVSGWARTPKALDGVATYIGVEGLKNVLEHADILVCLVPLTPKTRGLINESRLAQMKNGASLINFSRGGIICDQALLAALDQGTLAHAVLDVFQTEPLPPSSPFWHHPRVTVLPHVSGPSDPASAAALAARHICEYRLSGKIPASANKKHGY